MKRQLPHRTETENIEVEGINGQPVLKLGEEQVLKLFDGTDEDLALRRLFAIGRLHTQQGRVNWYTDAQGEIHAFSELSSEGQRALKERFEGLLQEFLQRGERDFPNNSKRYTYLRAMLRLSGDPYRCLYSVGGQPVLCEWGCRSRNADDRSIDLWEYGKTAVKQQQPRPPVIPPTSDEPGLVDTIIASRSPTEQTTIRIDPSEPSPSAKDELHQAEEDIAEEIEQLPEEVEEPLEDIEELPEDIEELPEDIEELPPPTYDPQSQPLLPPHDPDPQPPIAGGTPPIGPETPAAPGVGPPPDGCLPFLWSALKWLILAALAAILLSMLLRGCTPSGSLLPSQHQANSNVLAEKERALRAEIASLRAQAANLAAACGPIPVAGTLIPCNEEVMSGGEGVTQTFHALGSSPGKVVIEYNMENIPDKLEVFHAGKPVVSTLSITNSENGFVGEANGAGCCGALEFEFNPGVDQTLLVQVTGPDNTSWSYKVGCPTPAQGQMVGN